MKFLSIRVFVFFVILSFLAAGCSLPSGSVMPVPEVSPTVPPPTLTPPPTETQLPPTITPEPQIVHVMWPGSPLGTLNQTVHDQVDANTAPQKQAFGGDDFKNGKYERPFDPEMNYLPYADLVSIQMNREDPLWIYVTFKVNAPLTDDPTGKTQFMIEVDKDLDSRGDLLIISGIPKTKEWSTESVMVFTNPDVNVGGTLVVKPDPTLSEGRGYYQEIFNNGKGDDPDLAMSRISRNYPDTVLVAFKNTLIGGEKGKFVWLPWTDAGMHDPSLFEYNDHFTYEQAGYPVKDDMANYPLKALWGVDNTCRMPSGFTIDGTLPGLCPNYDPAPALGHTDTCVQVCSNFALMHVCTCQ
jgi:hypothetical protein